MPIFKPELIDKIVVGKKTQTRRPSKAGEVLRQIESPHGGYKPLGVYQHNRAKMLIGHDYAVVPGRGKPGVCWQSELQTWRETGMNNRCDDASKMLRIRVLDIRQEDVRNISVEDAIAEGFETRADFWRVWCGFYDTIALPLLEMSVAEKRFLSGSLQSDNARLKKRPDELYQAWAYTFEVVR